MPEGAISFASCEGFSDAQGQGRRSLRFGVPASSPVSYMDEVRRIAAAYPPEAKHTPAWEREAHLSAIQQLAWLIRFDPENAALALEDLRL